MYLRTGIYVLACIFAGGALFLTAGLGTVVFLADRHCSPAFGYYGCETPRTNIPKEGDQTSFPAIAASKATSPGRRRSAVHGHIQPKTRVGAGERVHNPLWLPQPSSAKAVEFPFGQPCTYRLRLQR